MHRSVTAILLALSLLGGVAAAPGASDTEAPALRAFFADWRHDAEQVHVNVFADDRQWGGSTIVDIAITVDGESFDVVPLDGAYDQAYEEVDVDLTPATVGEELLVCTTATDAAGNRTDERCETVPTGDQTGPFTEGRPFVLSGDTLGEPVEVRATVTDGEGTPIASASLTIDDGAPIPMAAGDGAFDEPTESVTATLEPLPAGTHRLCVRATDAAGNTSDRSYYVTPLDGSAPSGCVDLDVRDRIGPLVTDIAQAPSPAAFGEEVTVLITVDDRGRGDSDIRNTAVTIDGEELAPLYGSSDTGPVATIRVPLDGFAAPGTHEICAKARDEGFNTSEWTCGSIEITDRIAVGTLATRSLARPEAHIGPGATFTVDARQTPDGRVIGGFTYSEPGIEFAADLPADTVFEGRDLDHRLHATGTGLLHDFVTCDYELTVLDHAGQDDETDTLFLTITCNGTTVADGGEPATDGDVEIRA